VVTSSSMLSRTTQKCLLLGAVFIVNLSSYGLTSVCSATHLAVVGSEGTVAELPLSWLNSYDGLAAAVVTDSPNCVADFQSSFSKLPDSAATRVRPVGGEQGSWHGSFFAPDLLALPRGSGDQPATPANDSAKASEDSAVERVQTNPHPADSNREIYYRNKTELAFDLGTLPINIPFPFDFMEGDPYTEHPIKYTLIPILVSLRWQISNIGGPWIFRGNWDLTSSGSFTWIPSGPETRFISYDMGLRRNFVPRNRNFAPYFDIRLGIGQINAKGPKGVPYAQGENWPEFTMNMGTGVRYNFSPRFAFSAGLNYMHVSNMDLSEHKPNATDPNWGPINYGINVYGPYLGIDMRLGKSHRE
jgi:hypothetical protein